jgi:hypothetical protein
MGYGAAGLGYGAAQAFGGIGDALDRVLSRRDQRDQYEQGLKLDAEERQYRRGRDSADDAFRQQGVQRAAEAQAAALARQTELAARSRMETLTDRFAEVQASGEYPDARFIPGVAGPSRIDYGERKPYDFSASPEGGRAQWNVEHGYTPSGSNVQTPSTPPDERRNRAVAVADAINRMERYDPVRADQIAQQQGFSSAQEAAQYLSGAPAGSAFPQRTGSGMGSSEFYGRGQGGGSMSAPGGIDPAVQDMIDEERRREGR